MNDLHSELQQTIRHLQQIAGELESKKQLPTRFRSKNQQGNQKPYQKPYQKLYQKLSKNLNDIKNQQQVIQQDDKVLKDNQNWLKKSIVILMNELHDNQGNVVPYWGLLP